MTWGSDAQESGAWTKWRPWFAWFPVRFDEWDMPTDARYKGEWAWLRVIAEAERRGLSCIN